MYLSNVYTVLYSYYMYSYQKTMFSKLKKDMQGLECPVSTAPLWDTPCNVSYTPKGHTL